MDYVIKRQADESLIELSGALEEGIESMLDELKASLPPGPVAIDCREIVRINSRGIAPWINFLASLSDRPSYYFCNCSPVFIHHVNMLPSFSGRGLVRSFFASFTCPKCRAQATLRFTTDDVRKTGGFAPLPCPKNCGGAMRSQADPEAFLAFALG